MVLKLCANNDNRSFWGETIVQGVARSHARKVRERSARESRRPVRAGADQGHSSKRSQRSLATSERILDSAEELFAQRGIYGVTMREIAELAGVDTALLHYYFESKRGVFHAVFARRADVLNTARLAEFDRYEAENKGVYDVDEIVAAYLRPMFKLNREGGKGWRNFCAFAGDLRREVRAGAEAVFRAAAQGGAGRGRGRPLLVLSPVLGLDHGREHGEPFDREGVGRAVRGGRFRRPGAAHGAL